MNERETSWTSIHACILHYRPQNISFNLLPGTAHGTLHFIINESGGVSVVLKDVTFTAPLRFVVVARTDSVWILFSGLFGLQTF